MVQHPHPPGHHRQTQAALLPPTSSWSRMDLTALFNLDDMRLYPPSIPRPTPGTHPRVYLPRWETFRPGSPESSDSASSSTSSLETIMPSRTCKPLPALPTYEKAALEKPPPLYLHPFYSRSHMNVAETIGSSSWERGLIPVDKLARPAQTTDVLPRMPWKKGEEEEYEKKAPRRDGQTMPASRKVVGFLKELFRREPIDEEQLNFIEETHWTDGT